MSDTANGIGHGAFFMLHSNIERISLSDIPFHEDVHRIARCVRKSFPARRRRAARA